MSSRSRVSSQLVDTSRHHQYFQSRHPQVSEFPTRLEVVGYQVWPHRQRPLLPFSWQVTRDLLPALLSEIPLSSVVSIFCGPMRVDGLLLPRTLAVELTASPNPCRVLRWRQLERIGNITRPHRLDGVLVTFQESTEPLAEPGLTN